MLKVKSVDDAVAYWINTNGGKVTQSSRRNDKLQSAFVILGNGKQQQQDDDKDSSCFFALELVQTDNCQVGNVLNYIGVSMLLQFQKGNDFLQDLMAAKKETTTATASLPQQQQHDAEPHGIPVKSCASSPGDFLCRICLKSNNLVQTRAFYLNVLGMQVAAADESQLCLRYAALVDNSSRTVNDSIGVPTTLVFEGTNEKLDHGTCLDHLAIKTTTSIAEVFQRLQQQNRQESDDVTIYMTPTEMFGMTVMGLRDHNGYKIVLAGPA